MGDVVGVGVSGLQAAQRALNIAGNNIANVNTPGYSRQRVELFPTMQQTQSGLGIGSGVSIQAVTRVANEFLNKNVQTSATNVGSFTSYTSYAKQIDGVIADSVIGLSPSMQGFFDSVNSLADDPSSIPVRQTLLGSAELLTSKFKSLDTQIHQLEQGVNQELRTNISQINVLTTSIAQINADITKVSNQPGSGGVNTLTDQLDETVRQLSRLVGITATRQSAGSLDISTITGHSLVSSNNSYKLGTQVDPTNPSQLDIVYEGQSASVVITDSLTTGEVGGLINVRNDLMDQTRNSIGRIGAALAISFNELHTSGTDLSGTLGNDFFSIPRPVVSSSNTVTGVLSADFNTSQVANLTSSDYEIRFDGTSYNATRLNDKQVTNLGAGPVLNIDGLDITVATPAAIGDLFTIRPMRDIASRIDLDISEPREIAAAADPFTGAGDNSTAIELAALQLNQLLEGGNASFDDAYGQLIGDIGTKTQQAKNSLAAMEAIEESAIEARDSVSGVSLDEEAADLLKFQQAYQAAAQVINVGNELFGSLLQAIR